MAELPPDVPRRSSTRGRGALGVARGAKEKGGDIVIAVGGAWGTLSEIALARNVDREVILLDTWSMEPPEGGELDGVRRASTPAEAVELALATARQRPESAPKRQPGWPPSGLCGNGAPAIVHAALLTQGS